MTPSLVDVASSAERLSKLSVTEDRDKPASSTVARARTSALAAAEAAAEAKHEASVRRAYVTMGMKGCYSHFRLALSRFNQQDCWYATTYAVGQGSHVGNSHAQRRSMHRGF